MSKLERLKVDPMDYNILDDIDIQERWILEDKDGKCVLKIGIYKWKGLNHLRVFSPLIKDAFIQRRSEYKYNDESIYMFCVEAALKFKKDFPELFNNLGGFLQNE